MRPTIILFLILILSIIPSVHAEGWVESITNPLRALTEEAQQFDFITRIIVLFFSAAVAIIGAVAWQRNRNPKIKYIALAFGLLAFKWVLKVMDLFVSTGQFFPDHAENVIELVSLALIAYAIFSPRKG
ncbi:MAG: hypothetical protein AABW68_01335 [archaeon]